MNFEGKDVIFHGDYNHDLFSINLAVTSYCNYQCSYCCAEIPPVNSKSAFIEYQKIVSIIDRFFSFNKREYFIILTGGEPTIHPDFLRIIEYINSIGKEKKIILNIISNGSRSVDYYENIFKNSYNLTLTLRISIHLEYAKMEHIKEIIIVANKYNKNILLNFMLHPILREERLSVYKELLEFRNKYNFNISFDELQEGENYDILDSRYTKDDLQWIDSINKEYNEKYTNCSSMYISTPKYIIQKGSNKLQIPKIEFNKAIRENKRNFKNMYCCYGVNTFSIWGQGDATGGECPMFKRYNIYNNFFDWYNVIGYTQCKLEQCRCPFNDTLPKFKEEKDAINFIKEYKNNMSQYFLYDMYKQLIDYQIILTNNINDINNNYNSINLILNRLIDIIAWCIPIRKLRDKFRDLAYNTRRDK